MKTGGAEMNVEKTIATMQDNGGTPEEHLCYIVSQGFHLTGEHRYSTLIADPKFRCDHCGKQAAHDRNLCVPLEL
jgi:hypothetical protein